MQGATINGYTLKYRLGEGGMAEVWYAENEIGKQAAVKILNEVLSRRPQIVERFHNEALVMVKLEHPNIRQVYGYGYFGERHCIIMEYLDGEDLEAILRSGRHFTDEELRRWWNQTVDALNYTHSMDIVHRDIKPSNIFLDTRGNIKLLDFGIAKVKESMSMTRTGMAMGTLMYMSPEQVKDPKRVGPKSDVYSLAVSFVHLLTGKPIYDSDTSSEFDIQMSIVSEPVDLSGVPAAWRGFLEPYLAKNPEDRPALRHYEEVASVPPTTARTVVTPATNESKTVVGNTTPVENTVRDAPKGKTSLWVGIGVGSVALIVMLVLLLKPGADNRAFEACRNVSDYRAYLAKYGHEAKHYYEAKRIISDYVDDSIAKEMERQHAEMERLMREEEERQKQLLRTIRDEYINLLSINKVTGSDYDEGYFLYDIDYDGIPEIWIKNGTCEADYGVHVYTYQNGIKKMGDVGAGHCSFSINSNGLLLRTGGNMGYYFVDKIEYNGSSITDTRVYEEEYDFEKEITVPISGDKSYSYGSKDIDLYSLSNKQPIINTFYTD